MSSVGALWTTEGLDWKKDNGRNEKIVQRKGIEATCRRAGLGFTPQASEPSRSCLTDRRHRRSVPTVR